MKSEDHNKQSLESGDLLRLVDDSLSLASTDAQFLFELARSLELRANELATESYAVRQEAVYSLFDKIVAKASSRSSQPWDSLRRVLPALFGDLDRAFRWLDFLQTELLRYFERTTVARGHFIAELFEAVRRAESKTGSQ